MTPNISTLLEVLQDPENPTFAQAIQQLEKITPSELPPAQIPFLLAQLEHTIAHLAQQKNQTAAELQSLRRQSNALQSYAKIS